MYSIESFIIEQLTRKKLRKVKERSKIIKKKIARFSNIIGFKWKKKIYDGTKEILYT